MLKIFVTGGIGSGKSTLMNFLAARGAGIVLADEVGHDNLEDPTVISRLTAAFGIEILDEAGTISRPALAARAFATPEATARMDAITLPRLYDACLARIAEMGRTHKVVALEMAILDGRDNFYRHADIVVAVTTTPEVRVARLMASRGFSEVDARSRLARQVPEEQRLAIADVVFSNDGTPEEFESALSAWWDQDIVPRLEVGK